MKQARKRMRRTRRVTKGGTYKRRTRVTVPSRAQDLEFAKDSAAYLARGRGRKKGGAAPSFCQIRSNYLNATAVCTHSGEGEYECTTKQQGGKKDKTRRLKGGQYSEPVWLETYHERLPTSCRVSSPHGTPKCKISYGEVTRAPYPGPTWTCKAVHQTGGKQRDWTFGDQKAYLRSPGPPKSGMKAASFGTGLHTRAAGI